ncbi:unnamed protein product [Rotaria socialis]|uniref:Protein-tyrosine-phosphatase n=1 Tax=Rotaria socialis TaxID=392032 RepID=A0A821AB98_9BILA|nr:unnamed protein product [Rotaria socialis]
MFAQSSTIAQTNHSYYQILTSNYTKISFSSATILLTTEVPLLFSIVSLTIRSSRIAEQANFYSVDILFNSTCSSKRESNITLIFQSSPSTSTFDETRRCLSTSKHHGLITCENFIYGVRYTVDGYFLCSIRNITLSTRKEFYEIIKPKYLNSTNSPTSIDTLFFLPGLFYRLVVEITSINQTCLVEYSSIYSPFYNCLFTNLSPAQWFILSYYVSTDSDQKLSGDVTIVHTELEDLNFSCKPNENYQRIDFSWKNLTTTGYTNLTISLLTDEKKQIAIISCDPYIAKDVCSTKPYSLESGTQYYIIAKLEKILPNYNANKTGACSIKTNLSQIPIASIRHQFLNEEAVRLSWLNHSFHVQENDGNKALFINLTEASIYQLEFNISKIHWSSLIQMTDYYIQTGKYFHIVIENILRHSENSLVVNVNRHDLSLVKLTYCIQSIIDGSLEFCSTSNRFNQLTPGSIYNISISIQRHSIQNIFFWKTQTIFKLVNTNPSSLRIRTWKENDYCAAELNNTFPISYSTRCISNERVFNCKQLQCGCRYQFHILFNQTNIHALCSTSQCDIQVDNSSSTRVQFQTPLQSIENLRIISLSPIFRHIQVDFNRPSGCFDHFNLICEIISLKQRRLFVNSSICTDLIPDEFYRVYVETKQIGWETVISNVIEIQLILNSTVNHEARKKTIRKILTHQDHQEVTKISKTNASMTLNNIVNQVNIYPNVKSIHSTDSKKNVLKSRPIKIKDLSSEYEKLIKNNYYNVSNEFDKLQISLEEVPQFARCNQLFKNRYKNIRPYEHSRVKLIPGDECDPGYINANFITGLHNPREYIACQGPLKSTINDHWNMIWEQNVTIIVMLTELIECGMSKCERYWPVDLHHIEIFGNISARVIACVSVTAYDLRYIRFKRNDEIRSAKHYIFKMWDDHTIPTNSDVLIKFIRLIRSEYQPEYHGPLLVHCSAGVGRSGTFIALDRLLQEFDEQPLDGYLDIFGTISSLRQCRDKMVQNEHQYLFIYRCLKEEYEKTLGNSFI